MTNDDFRELGEAADDGMADVETGFDEGLQADSRFEDESGAHSLTGWRPPEPTGVPAVDQAVAALAELDLLPTAEHVAYYDAAHRHLQDALADLDGA